MIIQNRRPPVFAQRLPKKAPPGGPEDQSHLSERVGSAVIRGSKALLPGGAAGLAGAVVGTAGFYTLTWGVKTASMFQRFPQFLAVGAALGAGTASIVEAAAGKGTGSSLTRAAVTGGAVGAATGVALQLLLWSKPF